MQTYTFLKANQVSQGEIRQLKHMLESFFDTQHDPDQMQINENDTSSWISDSIPECGVIIKCEDEIVGSILILPCTLNLMHEFISLKINEAELFKKIKDLSIGYNNIEAIYICSAFIAKKHRGKNLAEQAFIQAIRSIMPQDRKLPLFYWAYSTTGKKISEKIAAHFKANLFARKPQ